VGPRVVLDGAENLASTGIRSPGRPSRSESLYRLSYPSHISKPKFIENFEEQTLTATMDLKRGLYHFTCHDIKILTNIEIVLVKSDTKVFITLFKKRIFLHYIRSTFDHPTRFLA
jgi:hypothetical protein